ncbi:MAG TPA: phosphate ABC transporter substrate-binding protein PstS [Solirubrobacteraceae bacterium]|jgi:phosphate transport system substrate-binding protein
MRKIGVLASAAALTLGVSACGSSKESSPGGSTDASASSTTLVGAGSTLVAPLVSKWQPKYNEEHEVAITYGAIGSGGGIAQITARTVDFGASDAPLSSEQFTEAKGVVQIPWALAATAVAYNVKGVSNKLHLTGPLLTEIYEGKVTTWNDSKIAALNPGVKLPSLKITPIHRSDGSGDTFAFTNYLSHISSEWSSKIGHSTEVNFPVGVGAKGNSGVGAAISSTNGAIGYIAIAYVVENEFDFAEIENAAGKFPEPGIKSITAAAAALKSVPSNNEVTIVDPPSSAPEAYPISTFTYAIVPLESSKATTMKAFLKWAISEGQEYGPELDFAPLPEAVVTADEATIEKIKS